MKTAVALLTVVAVLVAGLVVADRAAESYADSMIAGQLTRQLHLSKKADVEIVGFPFLTQWASGDYKRIEVGISAVTARSVTVRNLRATIRNVRARPLLISGKQTHYAIAGSVQLSGVVPFSSLPVPHGVKVKAVGSRLQVSGSISVGSLSLPVTAVERISLHGSTVTLTPVNVYARGTGIRFKVSDEAARKFAISIKVPNLPFSVHLTGLSVTRGGLRMKASGQHLPLAS